MKFKKFVLTAGSIVLVYKLGKLAGHKECLTNICKKYGHYLTDKVDEIVDDINKNVTLSYIIKGAKKGTASKGD